MATLNIYVPDTLKTEMDAVPTSPNWSSVCQTAIRHELTRLNALAGDKAAIVARVVAAGSKQAAKGYAAGKAYAAEHATIDDFESFSDWYSVAWEVDSSMSNADRALEVAKEMAKFFDLDEDYFVKDHRPTYRWLDGFANAMRDTWKMIEDEAGDL